MLSLKNLCVDHGALRALWDISLEVGRGEKVGLLGANGAGKSTTMGAIVGLYPKAGGTIHYDGQALDRASTAQTVAGGIALVPEGRHLFPTMSVLENLQMGVYAAASRKDMAASLERVYALFPILRDKAAQNAGELSGGQQQMVAIGRALMGAPKLLLLDEPSVGIAHRLKHEIYDAIRQIRDAGVAILMAEQDALSALRIAERAYVLEHGSVAREGAVAELSQDDHIRQIYLGVA